MTDFITRLDEIKNMYLEDLSSLKEDYGQNLEEANAYFLLEASDIYRFLAIAAYVQDRDVIEFKKGMAESTKINLSFFEKYDSGQDVGDGSAVSMLEGYTDTFTALASGDIDIAIQFGEIIGGRDDMEKEHDHIYDRKFGYLIKWTVLDNINNFNLIYDEFVELSNKYKSKSFIAYSDVCAAILERNNKDINNKFRDLLIQHRKLCQKKKLFAGSEDELLSVWGVGLANLAIYQGLNIDIDDPLIPRELLISHV